MLRLGFRKGTISKTVFKGFEEVTSYARRLPYQGTIERSSANKRRTRVRRSLDPQPVPVPANRPYQLITVFPKPPIVAHKRDRNLRDKLTKAKFTLLEDPAAGSFPCQKPKCKLAIHPRPQDHRRPIWERLSPCQVQLAVLHPGVCPNLPYATLPPPNTYPFCF